MKTRLIATCVALAALAAAAPTAASALGPPDHPPIGVLLPSQPQPPEPAPEPLKDACGVAVDSSGRAFVSSYYGHAVYVFDANHKYETQIPVEEPPLAPTKKSINGPCDLAVDSAGNLYVDNWHYDVVRYSPLAPGSTTYGAGVVIDSGESTGVTVDASDHVFVDDRTYVAEYEPSGEEPVREAGEPVRIGLGSLEDGYGVAVSDFTGAAGFPSTAGHVYVADGGDDMVKVYDPAKSRSSPAEVIDGDGTPQLGFSRLVDSDLAVDPSDGHLYVVDNLQPFFARPEAVLDEFSSLGHFRGTVPRKAAGGQSSEIVDGEPSAVTIFERDVYLSSGNYFNADDEIGFPDSQVQIFGPGAEVQTVILAVTRTGAGEGTVFSSSPAGLGCGTACDGEFTQGQTVILTAAAAAHSRFSGWTGCEPLGPDSAQCKVAMSGTPEVSAEFEPIPQRQLVVARSGSGAGTVSSAPAGIDCGPECDGGFDEGAEVTLTASPGPGSALSGWSGCDAEPAAGICRVTMGAARAVTAEFGLVAEPPPPPAPAPGQRILSVSLARTDGAAGTVTSVPGGIACGGACSHPYLEGTTVTLLASPASGSAFLGWGGCDSVSGDRCTVELGADTTTVAAFGPGSPGPLRVRSLTARGAPTLRVSVPGPGDLTASGKGLRPASALPLAAGKVDLRLKLNGAGQRALRKARGGRLELKVTLSFAPLDGGSTVRTSRAVSFAGGGARR